MKKNKTQYCFIAILLIHIFVYFFKIDNDVFAFQEYINRPNQTYTEQLLLKPVSYINNNSISDFPLISKSCIAKNNNPGSIAIWNAILFSYNSRVHHLLKFNGIPFAQTIRNITGMFKLNFYHKPSEVEDLEYCFLA